ncbi:putative RNA recognition motif domain, nucleotide-binding alpha-beta plait domain superfamily [Helianthus annuus]|uniref:RNA recognition motif domain, nucleotide-binding alpha-beta plait domain superfamily n=1 Tax=Helianthus annuus TaxID=4232 RepID=A0A9K3HTA3_HELAN|nr:putative RNA recognition motif domain, nucleotide-binding alpha-beta plait domain superfamily [Helianthus annuus]
MEETLTLGEEKTENAEIRINPVTKKKVRVVKKIVKKKIIRKVPKRVLIASNCNDSSDLGKVTSPNPNVQCVMEIEKDNVEIEGLKEAESVKKVEVSGLVASSLLLGDQVCNPERIELRDGDRSCAGLLDSDRNRIELQDGDRNQIELQDGDQNGIELQDGDRNRIELGDGDRNRSALVDSFQNQDRIDLPESDQKRRGFQNYDQNGSALLVGSQNRIELQDGDQKLVELHESDRIRSGFQNLDQNRSALLDTQNLIELQDSDQNRIGLQNNDENTSALPESSQNLTESQDSNENQLELSNREHDTNSTNVKEPEGENGVKELVKTETDALKSQEAVSETNLPNEKMVPSRLYTKHVKKIFIHGLGQETKEEDIRKVFEEVGEVVEVKVILNFKTGKKRGFGFVTFASAELANLALTKYQNVEICGRPCRTSAIEGIDTILLNNIDKKWNKEHVVELLQKIGIMKLDEVLVVPDPDNAKLNCGFAFLEFETKRDAQMAYHKLQNENVFGKRSNIKVSWASSSVDPVEEDTHNNKSVYAEHIPLSWDEKEVNNHFKTFGEIESIALAKNLRTTKRNDFAFINYKTCEAANSCIEALTCKKSTSNSGPTGQLKVSLAKSIPKVKPMKTISGSAVTEVSHAYQNANRSRQSHNQYQNAYQSRQSQQKSSYDSYLGVYKPPQKSKIMIGKHEDSRNDLASSTTAELVQLLREQASWKQGGPSSTTGHHQLSFGGKQPFTELESKSTYHHDPRAYHQSHLQIPNVTHHRPIVNVTSIPHYDQQRVHYESGSLKISNPDPRYIQTRANYLPWKQYDVPANALSDVLAAKKVLLLNWEHSVLSMNNALLVIMLICYKSVIWS